MQDSIYLLKKFKFSEIQIYESVTNIWESQFIKIQLDNEKSLTLGNIYRPPRDTIENYRTFIDELDLTLSNLTGEVLLSGDFNIDLLKIRDKPVFSEFFTKLLSNGYVPKITLPTRLTRNNGTLIDNHFCKISSNFSETTSGIILSNMSDHLPYFTCLDYLKIKCCVTKYVKITIQNEKAQADLKTFLQQQQICSKLSTEPNGNPDHNYNILHEIVQNGMNLHMPSKVIKFHKHKHKKSKWISGGIIRSIRFRDKLYQRIKKTPVSSIQHYQLTINLKTYNRILKKVIRETKKLYYEKQFKRFESDIKQTWLTIKEIIGKTKDKRTTPNFFNINNTNVTDDYDISKEFNNFFANVGPELASKIPVIPNKTFRSYLNDSHTTHFKFKNINEHEISKIIDGLPSKTSRGFDEISTKLMKYLKTEISKPLTVIINQSFQTGLFPQKLKIAKIIPIYKKDDETLLNNYRPISLLPSFSKVFEKAIFNQVHDYFKSNHLYYNSQYGFRELHSTELAALELTDRIIFEIDKGNVPISVFMDLSKAFDTIDHDILLHKLEYYGIRGQALSLFTSYLNSRKQYVEYNDKSSDYLTVKTGVPQGSILGPLLFIVYINDLCFSTNSFKFISYADDTTLFLSINISEYNPQLTEELINNNLILVSDWLKLNKLSLNINKTKCMAFRTRHRRVALPQISISNENIEYVQNFNFLGINFNENLNWNVHLDNICQKISKTVGILNKLKHSLPSSILKTIYNSLINSYLNYGALCWGYTNHHITILQKKAIRIITNSKYNAHTAPLFRKLRILKIEDIVSRKLYRFYFRYCKKLLPHYFLYTSFVKKLDHLYGTRNIHFQIPAIRHKFAECCVRYKLPKLLNKNIHEILDKIDTHSEFGFSLYIKNHFINKYEVDCSIPNCYVCGRSPH